jgi:spore cortex biosynthesis protein YabQ
VQATFVAEQLNTLGVTFSLGIAIGLCYDALNVLLIFIRLSKTAQFVIDLLFCLVMTALVFMVLLVNSWGVVRAYTFLAMGAGGLCYYLFCHRWCQSLMVRVVKFIIAAARFTAKPFIWGLQRLRRLLRGVFALFCALGQFGRRCWQKIKLKFHSKKQE